MSAFEWNKIIASVLAAMIVAMVTGIVAQGVVHPMRLEKPAYLPPGAEGETGTAPTAAAPAPAALDPIGPFMEKADAAHGQQVAKVCLQCHTFGKGEANKIGPNLFGVLDENIASVPGYTFSAALLASTRTRSGTRTSSIVWLFKPQDFAKGTKMTFAGLPKEQDRADVIKYLQTLK